MNALQIAPSCVSLLLIALILFGSIHLRSLLRSIVFRTREDRYV